jgi:hypothetical protein
LILVQTSVATCLAPEGFNTEIINGTQIKITLVPGLSNASTFTASSYSYTKSANIASGSFQDAQGHFFDNVLHYSCFEQFKRGMVIRSRVETTPNPRTGVNAEYPSASKFCVQKFNGSAVGNGCTGLPSADNSAQAYYYDFYIRSTESGDINNSNARYTCPRVKESISGLTNVGNQGRFYPLSSDFALSRPNRRVSSWR